MFNLRPVQLLGAASVIVHIRIASLAICMDEVKRELLEGQLTGDEDG